MIESLAGLVAITSAFISLAALILRSYEQRINEKRAEERSNRRIAEAESKVEREPEKTKPAWDLARVTLEAYFNRNLG